MRLSTAAEWLLATLTLFGIISQIETSLSPADIGPVNNADTGDLDHTGTARPGRAPHTKKQFVIPKGFVGDFAGLFKDFRSKISTPFDIISDDDGIYSGEHHIPYITAPSHFTFGSPSAASTSRTRRRKGQVVMMAEEESAPTITIFTQTSLDRVDMLPDLVDRWDGHVSVALYVATFAELPKLSDALKMLQQRFIEMGEGKFITVSLLFGFEFLISMGYDYDESDRRSMDVSPAKQQSPRLDMEDQDRDFQKRITGAGHRKHSRPLRNSEMPPRLIQSRRLFHPYDFLFPINSLRNLALSQSITSLVLSLDIDFLPSFRAHSILTSKPYLSLLTNTTFPATIILPAFEFINTPRKPFPILTLDYLRSSCLTSSILPFHAQPLPHQPSPNTRPFCSGNTTSPPTHKITSAHLATNYQEFFTQNATPVPYPALLPPHRIDRKFEPYVLARRELVPEFDETFRGYGFNKRAHSIMMQAMRVKFFVARQAFVVHRPHGLSDGKNKLLGSVKKTVGRAYKRFMEDVRSKHLKQSASLK